MRAAPWTQRREPVDAPGTSMRGMVPLAVAPAHRRVQWQSVPLFVLRVVALASAAAAATWGIAGAGGVAAAVAGAVLGVLLGHAAGLSRVRLAWLVGGALLAAVTGAAVGHVVVGDAAVVRLLGPTLALELSAVARFFAYAVALTGLLRTLAIRIPFLVGLELIGVAAAVVVPLAAHRNGVVARPLWLSDWAWHNGYDPAHVLMAIGGVVAFVLGGLLMARPGNRVSLVSWLSLAALVVAGLAWVDVDGLPKPTSGSDLGLTGDERGDPPLPTSGGSWDGPGRSHAERARGRGDGGAKPSEDQRGGRGPVQGQGERPQGSSEQEGAGSRGGASPGPQGQGQGQGGRSNPDTRDGQGGGKSPPPSEPSFDDVQGGGGTPAPMAVVLFGDDYVPPAGGYYFRQEVWSHFNGSRLVSSRRADVDRDTLKTFPSTQRDVLDPPRAQGRQPVTATVFLTVKHKRPFALESLVSMGPHRNPDTQRFVRAFTFDSLAQSVEYADLLGKTVGNPQWPSDVVEYYTVTPDDDRYGELATRIVSELPESVRDDPFAEALAIKLWLDDNVTYSTSERHAGATDPAAEFLFGSKVGYCVHIAHAAAYLWRSRGLTARVGTGYLASMDNLRGSALVIRASDAHAWPELYLEGVGWIILDITPKQTLDVPGDPADDALTEQLAEIARAADAPQAGQTQRPAPGPTSRAGLRWALVILALAALLVLYTVKLWRRAAPRWARGRHLPRVAYRRVLDQLGEAGFVRVFGETRTAFAARIGASVPSLAHVAAMAEAARLGNPAVAACHRPELQRGPWREALAAVSADLVLNIPARRRVAGLLNPFVPWQVR